jgi:DnaJ-class molecular chaperone with C-terminal Zn finger domain
MKKSEARVLLGIDKNASKDDIFKRYDIILKKYKNSDVVDGVKIEDVNEAYNLLMGYDLTNSPEIKPTEPSAFSKFCARLFKLDPKKVENFFNYNTGKIIIGIIALILIGSFIKSIVTSVKPDLFLTSVGQINITDSEKVQENLKSKLPELKAPTVEAMYLGPNDEGDQAYAVAMKVTTVLAAGDMDVVLVDKEKYESLAKQGAFEKVEDVSKALGIDLPKDESLLVKTDDGDNAVFGVDVTNSEFLKENNIKGNKMIAAIKINCNHKDAAQKLYKIIYESVKK